MEDHLKKNVPFLLILFNIYHKIDNYFFLAQLMTVVNIITSLAINEPLQFVRGKRRLTSWKLNLDNVVKKKYVSLDSNLKK